MTEPPDVDAVIVVIDALANDATTDGDIARILHTLTAIEGHRGRHSLDERPVRPVWRRIIVRSHLTERPALIASMKATLGCPVAQNIGTLHDRVWEIDALPLDGDWIVTVLGPPIPTPGD